MLISDSDSVFDYYARVMDFRAKGIYFNLAKYCVGRYEFVRKHQADESKAHDAGYDVWLTYLLMQEFDNLLRDPSYRTYLSDEVPF